MDIKNLQLLKKGGFANIFEKEEIVYKLGDTSHRELLRGQYRLLKELDDPHFVSVYDWIEEEDICGFSMELLKGSSIDRILPKIPEKRKEFDKIKSILLGILDSISYLHSRGIIHGDLKPSHIFVDDDNNVRIIDPGYCPDIITPRYAAPEAIIGDPSPASDIYSLGIILYEIITREKPFDGSLSEIIEAKLSKDITKPSDFNPSIPDELELLVERMTSRRMDLRIRSVSDVWKEMEVGSHEVSTKASFIPVFAGRKKELEYFEGTLSRLPEPHIIWVRGDFGMGKTKLLNQFRMKALIKGLPVKELACSELYRVFGEGNLSLKPQIFSIDDTEGSLTLPGLLQENAKTIRFRPIIILISSDREVEKIGELSDITTVLSSSPLNEEEIGFICDKNFPGLKKREDLIIYLRERTNGIPALINETLHYLCEEGIIERKREKYVFNEKKAKAIAFSPNIEKFLKFQIENLADQDRELLRMCSVFPDRIPLEFVNALDIDKPYILIESLIGKGLLRRNEGIVSFANKWIRDFLYQTLEDKEKERLYKNIIKKEGITDPTVLYPLQMGLGMKDETFQSIKLVAKERIKEKDYPKAISLLERALYLKKDKTIQMILARLLELVGNYKDAVKLYEKLHRIEPDNPYFLLKLGANQRILGILGEAEKNLQSAIDISSGFVKQKANYELGRLLLETERRGDASILISECKGELLPQLHYLRTYIAYLGEDYMETIRISRGLLNRNLSPRWKGAFLAMLGLAEQKKENYEESIGYFESAIEINRELGDRSNEAINLANNGFSLLRLDRYREAVGELESSLSIFKDARMKEMEERALWSLSVLYLRMGYWDKLKNRIQELKGRYGEIGPLLKEKMAYARMYMGDFIGANELIEELKEEGEDTAETEAILSSFKGEWEKAEKSFREVLKEVKGDRRREREISWRLSESLYHQGRPKEAIRLIQPYIKELSSVKSDFEKANLLSSWGLVNQDSTSLDKALELFIALDLPFYTGRTHLKKGIIYFKDNEIEKAVEHLRKSEDIFSKLEAETFLGRARKLLSECAEKLSGRSGYIRTYSEISQLLSSIDSEERFDEALSILTHFFHAERGAIILKVDDEDILISSFNIDKTTLEDATRISSTITGQTAKGEIIIAGDAGHDKRFRNLDSVNRNQIKAILCVPITAEDEIYGSLYLDSTIEEDVFLPRDKEFLQSMGRILGILFSKGDLLYRLKEENIKLKKMAKATGSYHSIVGVSLPMQEIYEIIEETAPLDINILITGETGTGKELVARTIHELSRRKNYPFITVDCSSLTETLLQSELFGHKKGSFTGAVEDKEGMCEKANKGILFLDEIGDAPLSVQAGLLHVSDRGEIRRVGETEWRKVNLRIIAATNKDLEQAVMLKEFRDDLYYRLNHITINIPPLRERREDIPFTARHYLKIFSGRENKEIEGFTKDTMEILTTYPWPGNIRELKHMVEIAVIRSKEKLISSRDLPEQLSEEKIWQPIQENIKSLWERELILRTLNDNNGNIRKTARQLNISRRHFYRLLKSYEIER
jgi:transcriptional regulator with GAF, ATPase, and Fis domain/serine/threonine protein kinase/predicted Zn-dependent protease